MPTSKRVRRVVLLGVTSVLAGLLLAQCRSVTDQVLGRTAAAAKAGSCVSECAKQANDLIRTESETHTRNVKECKGSSSCHDAEAARHEAAVKRIQDGRKSCQQACHHQGGGSGR